MLERKSGSKPRLVCPTKGGVEIKDCMHPILCPLFDHCVFMKRQTGEKLKPIKKES